MVLQFEVDNKKQSSDESRIHTAYCLLWKITRETWVKMRQDLDSLHSIFLISCLPFFPWNKNYSTFCLQQVHLNKSWDCLKLSKNMTANSKSELGVVARTVLLAPRRLRQKDWSHEFKVSMCYVVSSRIPLLQLDSFSKRKNSDIKRFWEC